jgi:hypothetical protein
LCPYSATPTPGPNQKENEEKKNEEKKKYEEERKQNQEKHKNDKNFVSVDGYIVGIGARYERLLIPKLSVGVDAYLSGWGNEGEIEAGAFARYYPLNNGKGLYGELGVGYHLRYLGTEDLEYTRDFGEGEYTYKDTISVTTTGVAISPGLGWKLGPGYVGGFFVELGISVPITIGEKEKTWFESKYNGPGPEFDVSAGPEFGVSAGFVVYLGLGWAW